MDWVKIVYSFILLIFGVMLFIATFSKKDDERKKLIKEKAQSYSFIVIIGVLVLEVAQSIYLTFQGNTSTNEYGISPVMFLTLISIIYLITLLVYRKKYGD